jgi:threonine synthase
MSAPVSPTLFSPELSQEFGLRIFLKPEIHSPTGSYKDRLGPAAIAEALQAGAARVVVTSSGNQGLAIAHAARAAGIPCLVIATQHIWTRVPRRPAQPRRRIAGRARHARPHGRAP